MAKLFAESRASSVSTMTNSDLQIYYMDLSRKRTSPRILNHLVLPPAFDACTAITGNPDTANKFIETTTPISRHLV